MQENKELQKQHFYKKYSILTQGDVCQSYISFSSFHPNTVQAAGKQALFKKKQKFTKILRRLRTTQMA